MPRDIRLPIVLTMMVLVQFAAVPITSAEGIANAGEIENFDSGVVGWWETYDNRTVVVNETGEITAFVMHPNGSYIQSWNYSLNTSINAGAIDNVQRRLALATDEGVRVISTEYRDQLYQISLSTGVDAVAWDIDGDLWMGARNIKAGLQYDDTTDTGIATTSHLSTFTSIVVTPNGDVVTGAKDKVVRASYGTNGSEITVMMNVAAAISGIYLINDGADILVVTEDAQLVTYSTSDWSIGIDTYLSHGGTVTAVHEGDNGTIYIGTHNGHLSLVNSSDFSVMDTFSGLGEIRGIKPLGGSAFHVLRTFSNDADILLFDLDSDDDGIVDSSDAFPNDATQQLDRDGDGHGDNPRGNSADEYPDDPSQWADSDGDGYGDNPNGTNGDMFPNNRDQFEDSDGDGYGDYTLGLDGDDFPDDPTQWLDSDGDGLGDNPDGTDPDDCPNSPGDSYMDRQGCPDSDNDGVSNPMGDEPKCSGAFPNGADAYPQDPSQYCDTDQDNYGDNLTGTNPDWCPSEWGNSTRGIFFDLEENKYQTIQRFGCIDMDGDGYEDSGERDGLTDWSTNKSEWVDSDRDGVGDNSDWDDLDPTVQTEEQFCEKYPEEYAICDFTPNTNSTGDGDSESSKKSTMTLAKEFVIVGGGIGLGLIALILAAWGIIGLIRSSMSKRAVDAQYTHQDATKELQAMEEGEEFSTRGGIIDEKGWEGESLGDGVSEDELWSMAEDISEDESLDPTHESSDFDAPDDSDGEAIGSVETEQEPVAEPASEPAPEPEPEPEPSMPSTDALPPGAPELPPGGLPAGWTMEQWVYYGHQWWEAKNKE